MGPSRFARTSLSSFLGRFGYELRRSDLRRRTQLMRHHGVDFVIDVGAAQGRFAHELRSNRYSGQILSFEPLKDSFGRLAAAASRDEQWDVCHAAAGASDGLLTINVASNSDSSSFLPMLPIHAEAAPGIGYVRTEAVRVVRLDDAVGYEGTRGYLKIDVQGFEKEVLKGARSLLERCVGAQLELSLKELYAGSSLLAETVEMMASNGFSLCLIEPGFRDPRTQRLLQADGVFFRE